MPPFFPVMMTFPVAAVDYISEGHVEDDVRPYDSNERANEHIRGYMKHYS